MGVADFNSVVDCTGIVGVAEDFTAAFDAICILVLIVGVAEDFIVVLGTCMLVNNVVGCTVSVGVAIDGRLAMDVTVEDRKTTLEVTIAN